MTSPAGILPSLGRHRAPAAVFLLLFALYAAGACRTVGPGDSGELTAVMCTWGVAHAPGYPLLSLVGNLLFHVPHPGEPALLLNLLSGLLAAAAAAVICMSVMALTGNAAAGIVAGLALGTSRVYWEYSLVVEVFAMNSFFAALLLFFLARFVQGLKAGKPVLWPLPASAAVMSTALTHHLTLVLVAIPVLVTYVCLGVASRGFGIGRRRLGRVIVVSLAAGLAGLAPLVYLPLAARENPVLNWDNPVNMTGLVRLLRREDFGSGTLMSPWAVATAVLEHGAAASPGTGTHFWRYWAEVPRNFGWFFVILPFLGTAWAALKQRTIALFTLLFLAMLTFFFLRVNSPLLPLHLGVTERFYILPNVVLAFLGGLGLAWVGGWISRRGGRVATTLAYVAAAAGTSVTMLFLNGPEVSQRHNTFTRDFGANFLEGIPPNALVLSEGDLYHNAFYYQQLCLGRRPDIEFVDQQKLTYPWYVNEVKRRGRMKLPAGMTAYSLDDRTHAKAWFDLNLEGGPGGGVPIVVVSVRDQSWFSDYRLVPCGLWWRVYRKTEVPPLAAQAAACEAAISRWNLRSTSGRYHERSWEAAEMPLYSRALAMLGGLEDLAANMATGQAPLETAPKAQPWLDRAIAISRGDSAAVLATRVEVGHRLLAEQAVDLAPLGGPAALLRKTIGLAEQAVRIDATNTAALGSLVALLPLDPAGRDVKRELEVRRLLAEQRPGSVEAVAGYVQLVIDLAGRPATRDPALIRDAAERQRRLIAMLDLAIRISGDASLKKTRDQWQTYLGRTEGMLW